MPFINVPFIDLACSEESMTGSKLKIVFLPAGVETQG